MTWQLHEARARFSELVRRAIDEGPQTVTRRGKEAVVVVAAEEFKRLSGAKKPDFTDFLMNGPDFSILELERDKSLPRDVEL